MNTQKRTLTATLGIAGLWACSLAGCQGPLAFQDPVSARSTPTWRSQNRFGQPLAAQPGYPQMQPAYAGNAQPAVVPGGVQQPMQSSQAPLLSWDGGVAMAEAEGRTNMAGPVPDHGLEPAVDGRMHILNLYQEVLDERDSLLAEVERLGAALQTSEAERNMIRTAESEVATRMAALEEAKRSLMEQNSDLASRLTTAQIRRLESEKLLLETQIAWHRDRAAMGAGAPKKDGVTAMVEKL